MSVAETEGIQKFHSLGRLQRFPLWVMLVIPLISLLLLVVAAISYLSYRNSQEVIDDVAAQLLHEIDERIQLRLETFLETAQHINRTNEKLIQQQILNIADGDALGRYFWEQVQHYPRISSMYFGNPDGGLVVGGREADDDALYIMATDNLESGTLKKHAIDDSGNLSELLFTVPEFDARVRPWYTGALEHEGVYWTSPYILSTGQDLAIASSLLVYDEQGNVLGVTSVDLFFSHINEFLENLDIGEGGLIYIVEHSWLLIASSVDTPTVIKDADENWQRLHAGKSENQLVAVSAQNIMTDLNNQWESEGDLQLTMEINGEEYYLNLSPYHIENLDWVIVTLLPQDDFSGGIIATTRTTLLLTFLAVLAAVGFGTILAIRITQPISRLSAAANQLARGDWSQRVPIRGVQEVQILGQSFNMMADQISEAFTNLEDRVEERTRDLEQSENYFRAIVEDQTDLICRFTEDYKLTFVNNAYCRFYSKSREELLGNSFMPLLHQDDQAALEQRLSTVSLSQPVIRVQHRTLKADGEIRWMEWVDRGIYDESGNFIEFQAVGRDITDARQQKEALEKALERESELSALKTDFITSVSHEFRTPLSIISSSAEIIQRYEERISPEKKDTHFERIHKQIQNMTNLLRDIVIIHQTEADGLKSELTKLDLVALCESVTSSIQTATPEASFTIDASEACKSVWTDKELMRLIVFNLISNAAKYTIGAKQVEITLHCVAKEINLTVKDEGIGIPTEAQPNIFEPFYRANNVDGIDGTGLGLAIVKRCVDALGGTISFESAVDDVGTTFTVTLPNMEQLE